ncbi:molybdopterin-guanine dinucleotide biosynthesis protein B [Chloroflexota bacterium]
MIPAVAFVGPSQVGKTTIVESLIEELRKRSHRVATIKHSGHGMVVDTPLKDSWRFTQSGSDLVVVASDRSALCIQNGQSPYDIEEILRLAEDRADIALVEGFKQSALPKIEVHRKAMNNGLTTAPETLIGLVTDEPLPVDVPQFSFSDIPGIADLVVQRILQAPSNGVRVRVNGKELFLKPFMKLLVARTVLAMISSMKGGGDIRTLDLTVRNPTGKWGSRYEGWCSDD